MTTDNTETEVERLRRELEEALTKLMELGQDIITLRDTLIRKEQELVQERCKRRAAEILSGAPKVWQPENHHLLEE